MRSEELEFSISQYLDGNLADSERTALESRLKEDPHAQSLLAEYRRLDVAMKAVPLPAVRWDALALSISSAVEALHEEQSARVYRMPSWVRLAAPLSLAAAVLISASVGLPIYLKHLSKIPQQREVAVRVERNRSLVQQSPSQSTDVASAVSIESSMVIVGPETMKTTAVEDVTVGPSAAVKNNPAVVQYNDDVVSRRSSVTIASGVVPVHDDVDSLTSDMQ